MSVDIEVTRCLRCGALSETATDIMGRDAVPPVGAIILCFECGFAMRVEPEGKRSALDLDTLDADNRANVKRVSEAIVTFQSQRVKKTS